MLLTTMNERALSMARVILFDWRTKERGKGEKEIKADLCRREIAGLGHGQEALAHLVRAGLNPTPKKGESVLLSHFQAS